MEDLYERFEDVVGVTLYEDRPVEHILFWVSDASKNYVITKPIHESQILYQGEKEQTLHTKYPSLEGGSFFSVDCIYNYELIRELCSFGMDLIVLQPSSILDEIINRVREMNEKYSQVRT